MNGLPYYKRFPRDFIEGTVGMPFEVKAAYSLVLDLIYMQGGRLPDEPRYIAGLLGCSVRKWKALREDLVGRRKIIARDGVISNFRADKEIETTRTYQDTQRENRRGSKKNKTLRKPPSNHTEPESDIRSANALLASQATPPKPKVPDRFQEFWDRYPHRNGAKKDRAKAEAIWTRLMRAGTDPEVIIAAADRYRSDGSVTRGFGKGPVPWLNGRCWQDEIEPPADNVMPFNGGPHGRAPSRGDIDRAYHETSREYERRLRAGEIDPRPDPSDPDSWR